MKFGYTIIYVPDVAATASFYEQAFGIKKEFTAESGLYIQMATGQTKLAFVDEKFMEQSGKPFTKLRLNDSPPGIEIALVTDDVQAAYDHAVKNGAQALQGPTEKPWGQTISYVHDCNGVLVEICSPVG